MIETILVVVHVLLAAALIGLVLIQHGKGADAGAAFGSGASATVFGARGASSFLSRSTAILATLFFLTSLALAYYAMRAADQAGVVTKTRSEPAKARVPAQLQGPAPELPAVPEGKPEGPAEVPAAPPAKQ